MRVAADNPSQGTTGCVFCTDSFVDVMSCSRWKLFNTYPHKISTLRVSANSSVACST